MKLIIGIETTLMIKTISNGEDDNCYLNHELIFKDKYMGEITLHLGSYKFIRKDFVSIDGKIITECKNDPIQIFESFIGINIFQFHRIFRKKFEKDLKCCKNAYHEVIDESPGTSFLSCRNCGFIIKRF